MKFWRYAGWLSSAAAEMLQDSRGSVLNHEGRFVDPELAGESDVITTYPIHGEEDKGLTAIAIGTKSPKFLSTQDGDEEFVSVHSDKKSGGLGKAKKVRVEEKELPEFAYKIMRLKGDEAMIQLSEDPSKCLIGDRDGLETGDCKKKQKQAVFRFVPDKEQKKASESEETGEEKADDTKKSDDAKKSDDDAKKEKSGGGAKKSSKKPKHSESSGESPSESGSESDEASKNDVVSIHRPGHRRRKRAGGKQSVVVVNEKAIADLFRDNVKKLIAPSGSDAAVFKRDTDSDDKKEEKMKNRLEYKIVAHIADRVREKLRREKKKEPVLPVAEADPALAVPQPIQVMAPPMSSPPVGVQDVVPAPAAAPRQEHHRQSRKHRRGHSRDVPAAQMQAQTDPDPLVLVRRSAIQNPQMGQPIPIQPIGSYS